MSSVIAWKPATFTPELASAGLGLLSTARNTSTKPAGRASCSTACRCIGIESSSSKKRTATKTSRSPLTCGNSACGPVFDLCDNHFYNPMQRADYHDRAERLRRMIDDVDAVTASTPELAALVDRPCDIIDDALDAVHTPWWERGDGGAASAAPARRGTAMRGKTIRHMD